jgi:hypothetical protein
MIRNRAGRSIDPQKFVCRQMRPTGWISHGQSKVRPIVASSKTREGNKTETDRLSLSFPAP